MPCYFVFKAMIKINKKLDIFGIIMGAILAEIIMISGYFLFEIPLYGVGVALAGVIGNITQGVIGAVSGSILYSVLRKSGLEKRVFKS